MQRADLLSWIDTVFALLIGAEFRDMVYWAAIGLRSPLDVPIGAMLPPIGLRKAGVRAIFARWVNLIGPWQASGGGTLCRPS